MVKIIEENEFDSFVASKLVLVDFFAEWCGPCKMLSPVLEGVAQKLPEVGIGKINIDNSPSLAERFEVSSVPTLILLKNGTEVERSVGLKDEDFIIKMIQKHQ